jgi:hypothetical protein
MPHRTPPSSLVPALFFATVLLTGGVGAAFARQTPLGAPTAALDTDRTAVAQAMREAKNEIGGDDFQSFERYEDPSYIAALQHFWTLIARWTALYLDAHPAASAEEVKAELEGLDVSKQWLSATALRLGGRDNAAVVSLDAGFAGGTFFVLALHGDQGYMTAWSIAPLAAKNFAARNEVGHWAYTVPGFHDGPLGGTVMALAPTDSGRPRFLIDALAHASMGLEVSAQLSIWEWAGSEARLEFIGDYQAHVETHEIKVDQNTIHVATKEVTEVFYGCGSCDEPHGTWNLRLTGKGVTDLGHAFDEPLLQLADQLLQRVARDEDASPLASAEAINALEEVAGDLEGDDDDTSSSTSSTSWDAQGETEEDPLRVFRGMLDSFSVSGPPTRRVLNLSTDTFHLLLTVVKRNGADYVVKVERAPQS